MSYVDDQPVTGTLGELVARLGGVPLDRIRSEPPLGTATEQDVVDAEAIDNRLCELVDGVLVEKAMGYIESILAGALMTFLRAHVIPRNLGVISGPDGMMRLFPGLVRIPDVAYASWDRFPDRQLPRDPVPDLYPDLAVEIISRTNTPAEMQRKRREYFKAGVQLVWIVQPEQRVVTVFTSADDSTDLDVTQALDGGDVLPGLRISVAELFSELDRKGD